MIGPRFGVVAAMIALTLAVMAGLYWKGRLEGVAAERPKIAAAKAQAQAAGLEAAGERASAARVDVVVRQQSAGWDVARDLAIKAAKSEDANVPLDPDRVLRLRDADGKLCQLAPELVGCSAPH